MANEIEKILEELNISLKVAYITGDDLMPRMDILKEEGESFFNIDKNIIPSNTLTATSTHS